MAIDTLDLENKMAALLETDGFDLVDLKFASHNGKPLVQVFADRLVGTITLDECGDLSNKLGDMLDAGDFYPNGYFLEVSSPGMDRVIKKEKDFVRFAGRQVKVRLKQPFNGGRVHYGAIAGCADGTLALAGGEKFKLSDIDEVRLHPADDEILKGK